MYAAIYNNDRKRSLSLSDEEYNRNILAEAKVAGYTWCVEDCNYPGDVFLCYSEEEARRDILLNKTELYDGECFTLWKL